MRQTGILACTYIGRCGQHLYHELRVSNRSRINGFIRFRRRPVLGQIRGEQGILLESLFRTA
jgi:hypothetical protein